MVFSFEIERSKRAPPSSGRAIDAGSPPSGPGWDRSVQAKGSATRSGQPRAWRREAAANAGNAERSGVAQRGGVESVGSAARRGAAWWWVVVWQVASAVEALRLRVKII